MDNTTAPHGEKSATAVTSTLPPPVYTPNPDVTTSPLPAALVEAPDTSLTTRSVHEE